MIIVAGPQVIEPRIAPSAPPWSAGTGWPPVVKVPRDSIVAQPVSRSPTPSQLRSSSRGSFGSAARKPSANAGLTAVRGWSNQHLKRSVAESGLSLSFQMLK